ncbi:TFIIH subunit Tfb4/GTF2H3 [Dillenia turbinata]|uniref:General transcription and DNA repair factor IIH subunit TFB4 n=1 Tax=Dillenia turbinata TaxID=194707 RepID=A0AAN8W1U4_9MAGN
MSPAPSVASKLYADDVSLLMVLVDTNPFFWGTAAANSSSLSFSSFLSHVLAFLNSIHLVNQLNHVVVIATGFNSCQCVYDSSETTNRISDDGLPAVYLKLLHNLEEFVNNDEKMCKNDFQTGLTSSLLSGSLSMALCYIQRVFRSGPLHPQPRILCIQGSPDGPEQYVAIMNSIFSAQRSMVPIDSCVIGAQHSAFLQQASYITGGVYLKPQHLDGLFQYLSMVLSFNDMTLILHEMQAFLFLCLAVWALTSTCSQMQTVFATDLHSRSVLQLPKPVGVDFRASCFCHKNTIDMGYICSVCLSIFCEHHKKCSTCGSVFGQPQADASKADRKRKAPGSPRHPRA